MSGIIWNKELVHSAVEDQKAFFATGATLDVSWRIEQLKKLRESISSHEAQLRGVIVAVSESDSVLQGTPQLLQPLLCAGPGNELSLHFNQALGHATCNQSINKH